MDQELAQLKVIVTGAASGIGEACAVELGKAGASVLVNCFKKQKAAERIARRVTEVGGTGVAHCADVSDETQVSDMFRYAVESFGTVDVLVNNAGIQKDAAFTELSMKEWQRVLDVNLTGQFLCARAAVREFLRPDRRHPPTRALGNIISMSSVHQAIPWAGHANYATAKGGVTMLMKTLAQELAGRNIRVNAIAPGAIKTAINEDVWKDASERGNLLELIPYGRIGEVDDVARVVRWLASDASDYVVGATVAVDGGMLLYPGFRDGV